ncbi:MAG: L,D-transpeptidase family protein [Phycisphaeraceae bacterium]|nr:L,D-transpeptidase family protein [Phycisphaeraceae bacterium]
MALASQTARSSSARRTSSNQGGLGRFRRRKARVRRRNFTIVILVILAGFWWLVLRDPGASPKATIASEETPQQDPAADRAQATNGGPRAASQRLGAMPEPTIAARTEPPRGAVGAPAHEPISVITMGESMDPGASVADAIDRAQREAPGAYTPGEDPVVEAPASAGQAGPAIASMISRAESAVSRNRLVEARALYNKALFDPGADAATQALLRGRITELNDTLLFSPTINEDDPFAKRYAIEPGDALSKLPRKLGLNVNWRFLQRINGISDPTRVRVGQQIKTVAGPFHAVISKSAYRMDLYMGESSELMYVASFPVGLGENDSTPVGSWIVRPDSKLVNPRWVNPRTGEAFEANDPKNPIGERWIGIEGIDERTKPLNGFGIHGTIDPGSIGRQASMGCIRLGDDDVALVYELLIEGVSRVEITP